MTPKYDWVAGQYKSKLIAFSSVIVYFVFRLSLSERLWRWQSIEITNLLSVPRARTTFASRRFNVAVLSVWNSLLLAFALIVSRSQWSHTFRCLHNKKNQPFGARLQFSLAAHASASDSTSDWLTLRTIKHFIYFLPYLLITEIWRYRGQGSQPPQKFEWPTVWAIFILNPNLAPINSGRPTPPLSAYTLQAKHILEIANAVAKTEIWLSSSFLNEMTNIGYTIYKDIWRGEEWAMKLGWRSTTVVAYTLYTVRSAIMRNADANVN